MISSTPTGREEGRSAPRTSVAAIATTATTILPLIFVEVRPLVVVDGEDYDGGNEKSSLLTSSETSGHQRRSKRHPGGTAPAGVHMSSSYVKLQLMQLSSSSSSPSCGCVGNSFAASSDPTSSSTKDCLHTEIDDDDLLGVEERQEEKICGRPAAEIQQHKLREMVDESSRVHHRRDERLREFVSGSLWVGDDSIRGPPVVATGTAVCFGSSARRPTIRLESENPGELELYDCCCRGYIETAALRMTTTATTAPGDNDSTGGQIPATYRVVVTDATLVHVLPPSSVSLDSSSASASTSGTRLPAYVPSSRNPFSFLSGLVGECADDAGDQCDHDDSDESVLAGFNTDAVRQLTWRLSRMLFHTPKVMLGSTRDAVSLHQRHRERIRRLRGALDCRDPLLDVEQPQQPPSERKPTMSLDLGLERMLLIHSPNHGEGKTMLLRAILRRLAAAQSQLTPNGMPEPPRRAAQPRILIRVLRLGPFIAKYGVYADVALETWVHSVAFQAAVRNLDAVCLVVDGIEAIVVPPRAAQLGDASAPALQNMAAYVQSLGKRISLATSIGPWDSQSPHESQLQSSTEIPFPVKNRLYNVGSRGFVASIRFGLVAIATCSDNIFSPTGVASSVRDDDRHLQHFATLFADRYRVPASTSETRLRAFRVALRHQRLAPSPELEEHLPGMVASATWASGEAFRNVARHAQAIIASRTLSLDGRKSDMDSPVSVQEFHTALRIVGRRSTGTSSNADSTYNGKRESSVTDARVAEPCGFDSLFSNVGGNHQAKSALEDALALDPDRRRRLASVGMSPPTGIMLVGPPGTGKTMLAKAVANALRSTSATGSHVLRGAFITLSSSDLVRAEVGEGEKMVVQAFEAARTNAPAVVFIDEFQALFTDRSSGGSSRMTTALLESMDELRKWAEVGAHDFLVESIPRKSESMIDSDWITEHRVVVLAATNTPWMIDKAFLRPGRFDRCVQVSLPSESERHTILRLHVSKMRIAFHEEKESIESMCRNLAAGTEGFSGADLAALCRAAAVRCLLERSHAVEERHLISARQFDVRPSSNAELVQRIANWKI